MVKRWLEPTTEEIVYAYTDHNIMSYEQYKKKMKEIGIDCYKTIIPKLKEIPKHCYKCGMLEYENHECENEYF